MRILIIGVNFAPEPTGNAPYTTALARALADRGHEVCVLTAYPHYPQWHIPQEWTGRRRTDLVDGVVVHRVRPFIPRHGGTGAGRLLMELHFGVLAATTPWPRPDVVLGVSPALFGNLLPLLRVRLTPGLRSGLWVQDLYSKGAEELAGGLSRAAAGMATAESAILNLADSVSVIHPRFAQQAIQRLRVSRGRVVVHRNWSHLRPGTAQIDRQAVRAAQGWGPEEIVLLHAGNMGAKQGLENVVAAAAESHRRGSALRWVLMGSGSQHEQLQEAGRGIPNLQFLPPQDDQQYQALMRSADLLVVNEKPGLREMAVPSKLTSYFRAGLPVLAAVEPDGTTAEEIQCAGAGVIVRPGRPHDLVDAALALGADPVARADLGAAGARHAAAHLAEDAAVDRYESWLASLAGLRYRSRDRTAAAGRGAAARRRGAAPREAPRLRLSPAPQPAAAVIASAPTATASASPIEERP